ncbi:MAG: hypothetical protein JW891_10365 [Candidatus Lokiarchaeota archaeon]|nr:hypothetical protein [Candidatus Lokiarchaeota archaeon]
MSEKIIQNLVKDFIKEVKEKLPEWIKDKKDELRDVLDQLEEHIWDKATELSETGEPTEQSIRLAIEQMGTPNNIAKEYKRRGTPKYFISEELFPLYKKALTIVLSIIIAINIISFIVNAIFGNWENITFNIFGGLAMAFAVITIIFVALSMEGYFPEDFKSKVDIKKSGRELQKAIDLGLPVSPKTGKQLKPFVKPGGKIAEGIFGMIIGFVLVIQPVVGIEDYFDLNLLTILRVWGIFSILEGALNLTRGIIGNTKPQTHQIILGAIMCSKIGGAMMFIFVILNPAMIPWIDPNQMPPIITISPEFYEIARGIVVLIMMLVLLSTIEEVYWMIKLENYKSI